MRALNSPLWALWSGGGPFIGDAGAPHGRVTVEPGWYLNAEGPVVGNFNRGPVRWWQRAANDQVEVEVPNIKSINIERSIDTDAASCDIELTNQIHVANLSSAPAHSLGQPGAYTWNYGESPEARARWQQAPGSWLNVLVPNSLLRSYQGYGGKSKTIPQAVADGNIYLTGVWLVDEVIPGHNGTLMMRCRDMAALLLDQICFPPLIPEAEYPLRYCRFTYTPYYIPATAATPATPGTPGGGGLTDRRSEYGTCPLGSENSGSDVWYGHDAAVHGHRPSDAFDGDTQTLWMSVGNGSPDLPFAVEWLEICVGEDVNCVYIHPWAGHYTCYISVYENGGWVDGSGGQTIAYDPQTEGLYTGANAASIPWVAQVGIPFEQGLNYDLPRTFAAQKIRLTFTNLHYSDFGPYRYRAGVRECRARLRTTGPGTAGTPGTPATAAQSGVTQGDGNYRDYVDIVRDLLLWSGFWLQGAYSGGAPTVFGNIESTGIYSDDCISEEVFDKKPIIDPIKTIKEIVGYLFWINDEGGAQFECVDDETEILTKRGWLRRQEVRVGDEALALDPASRMSRWERVDRVNEYDVVDEELVSIEHRSHSSLTTRNHRWWVENAHIGRSRGGRWRRSDELRYDDTIQIAAEYGSAPIEAVYDDAFVELVGWWVTEGSKAGSGGYICQSHVVNGPHCARIQRCFEKMYGAPGLGPSGWRLHNFPSRERDDVWLFGSAVFGALNHAAPDRVLSMEFLLLLTVEQLRLLVATCMKGDGHEQMVGQYGPYGRYYQLERAAIRSVEVACVLAGIAPRTTLRPGGIAVTSFLKTKRVKPLGASRNRNAGTRVTRRWYSGKVWCPTLANHHIWMARRHGTVYFTGNSPNWWAIGNFTEDGSHTTFMPAIDEATTMTAYQVSFQKRSLVSEIIISSERPVGGQFNSTVSTRFRPPSADLLRGIEKPFGWVNQVFQNRDEQRIMAELVALHIFFQLRQGQVTAAANPLIGINDQVRLYERTTGETFVHYVRGVSTRMDMVSGLYTMTLTTHWMGDGDDWAISSSGVSGSSTQPHFQISDRLAAHLHRTNARSVSVSRLGVGV